MNSRINFQLQLEFQEKLFKARAVAFREVDANFNSSFKASLF